jgi:preprotein translocase subunit SecA
MSAFGAGLSAGKLRHAEPEEIEEMLADAAAAQIDKKDCSQLDEFLKDDFAIKTFVQWARAKFDVKLDINELKDLKADRIRERLTEEVNRKYKEREIAYPVEFAMNIAYGPQGPNVYAFETLAQWANKRFNANFTPEKLQNSNPQKIYTELLELSRRYHEGYLAEEVAEKIKNTASADELARWANNYFEADLTAEDLNDKEQAEAKILDAAREFFRQELGDLERYVLLQIYDSTWKDHLYSMDHLKDNIFMRGFAEKDPKIEYKREGYQMFGEMLRVIEDKVADTIFKVRLEPGAQTRSVWNVSHTQHDEVGQFAMTERQRAAATAPQGEQKVKQIRHEHPRVGRNDPCPCGSGKKYKKCCGKNV